MQRLVPIFVAMLLSGCVHVDTGQADYRVAEAPTIITNDQLRPTKCFTEIDALGCKPILPGRIFRRYMPSTWTGSPAPAAPSVYSIEIEQGVIGRNLLEGIVAGHQFGNTAEFAILANVFEFAADGADAKKSHFIDFAGPPGEKGKSDDPSDVELKLIYFSRDVKKDQPFNFSNIPLQKRSIYNGRSIGIQIVVLEIDANGPLRSLLTTLARFGQQAVPGPSEVKDLIFDLGESLFSSSSQDDVLFDYRFVLSAPGTDANDVRATFAPGRYVLRRQQNRIKPMTWDDVRIDHNTGRLLKKEGGIYQEVRDELYLTLNIKQYPEGTPPENYEFSEWSKFRAMLDDATAASGVGLASINDNLIKALAEKRSSDWYGKLALQWASATSALDQLAKVSVGDVRTAMPGCILEPNRLMLAEDAAERDARDAIRNFVSLYKIGLTAESTATAGTTATKDFTQADHERLVSLVARYFMPWEGADEASFADASAFETAFIAAGDSPLADRAVQLATARHENPETCADLVRRGLATAAASTTPEPG